MQVSKHDTPEDLEKYLKFYSSDSLDFGKVPESPSDQALRLAESLLQTAGTLANKTSKKGQGELTK